MYNTFVNRIKIHVQEAHISVSTRVVEVTSRNKQRRLI